MLLILVEILMWGLALSVVPITGLVVGAIHERMIARDVVPHREMASMFSGTAAAFLALVVYLAVLAYRIVEVLP